MAFWAYNHPRLLEGKRSCAGLAPQHDWWWILGGGSQQAKDLMRGGLVVAFHYGVYTLVVR